jgi:hypothetical protein
MHYIYKHFENFSLRDFTLGWAAGMFFCTLLFNYVFWMHQRRKDGLEFLRRRFGLKP